MLGGSEIVVISREVVAHEADGVLFRMDMSSRLGVLASSLKINFTCPDKASLIVDLNIERADDARFKASDGQAREDMFYRSSGYVW